MEVDELNAVSVAQGEADGAVCYWRLATVAAAADRPCPRCPVRLRRTVGPAVAGWRTVGPAVAGCRTVGPAVAGCRTVGPERGIARR